LRGKSIIYFLHTFIIRENIYKNIKNIVDEKIAVCYPFIKEEKRDFPSDMSISLLPFFLIRF
jgi:hypothetical protein